MTAYALAHLRPVPPLDDGVFTYLERIQGTLDPFGGRFLVHGADAEVIEGPFEGAVVVIEFPDLDSARAWYASDAYQEILPLRTGNIPGEAIIVQGASPDHDAAALGRQMRALQAG